ncbi:hypothetical protein BU23DRAFT_601951 [Bimuria novae-zelandiae CBS 107.79]|uniref:Uncharacterized protein n=1 Tax=Bimuria novae-zelandiae CBS 107.79 TaxID=1447943 RepID=A0A6A5UV02_9PLEO|nr:hypothetical protein BU23DRAFT_601951 [Bimuria novae-zelandiae CBS 107.79]
MDEPARKRRKTASPEEQDGASSPLKQPPRRMSFSSRSYVTAENRQTSPLKEPPRRFPVSPTKGATDRHSSPLKEPPRKPPRRPSFASPTKASLARGYPDLLQRPSFSGLPEPNGRTDIFARGKQARAFILGDKDGASQAAPSAMQEPGEETAAGASSPHPPRPQPNTTPRAERTRPRKNPKSAGIGLDEETDLPATPSQRETDEQYTPRPGLFSSPSKRPPRLKGSVKQSPLQKKAPAVQRDTSEVPLDEPILDADRQVQQENRHPPDAATEEKKQEKARLTKELKALEKQVSRCVEEIAKVQAQPATYVASPEERQSLIALITELCKSDEESEEDKPQPISALLSSFLPFSTRRLPPPKPEGTHNPIASHKSLDLDDPLPYLQMFTSFKFSTRSALPRGQNPLTSRRVHQKHVIDITGPQTLLTASIAITIDTLTSTILDLKLVNLSHWADRELGAFIRAKGQDLGNACWAIGSYWELAKKRAEYWQRCEVAFAHLIPGRSHQHTENINVQSRAGSGKGFSRKDLNRHLGRDVLVLEDRHVVLRITWTIGFDWTGEAESEVRVVPAVPRVWREADDADGFKKIPETFDSLLHSKGVFAATKTMVALLFEE